MNLDPAGWIARDGKGVGQMLCDLGLHRVDPATVWNAGVGFSRCLRCRAELVRRPGSRWSRVPDGHIVIWRSPTETRRHEWRGADGQMTSIEEIRPEPLPSMVRGGAVVDLAEATGSRALNAMRKVATIADRPLAMLTPPREQASRTYRYLVRRIAAARGEDRRLGSVLLSAVCDAAAADEALLLLSAMARDELGGRLLIVDATLRDDGISALLDARGQPGLSEGHYDDPASLLDLVRPLPISGLSLLSAGLYPPATRPQDMAAMLPVLTGNFDHVLIQQHAVTSDTRYLALASCADLVLVLAEEGRSRMAGLKQARDAFHANNIGNVGMILTVPADDAAGVAPAEAHAA